ncbi:putative bark agglutinin LECRPA3 [Lotus japonicus]|uniref:putative bark agglutinin LECRPA3 n=1 Tax=Lotus japonicus TaxID=34305 RepID=UPI002590B991|nr:putative bark agglutinin LECRPA3 [Lotus japonicus]
MATPYSNPSTKRLLLAALFLMLAINVNSAQTVSFNYTEFIDDGNLILQGDAKIWTDGSLAMPTDPSIGKTTSRALYATPVPLWDNTTGNVASFITSFSFVVTDVQNLPADGVVFFLAPWGTEIPPNSEGGYLGICDSKSGLNQFVAVEFDSHPNTWDPSSMRSHIGIDVNSIISLNAVNWNRVSGSLEKVTIIYDSLTKTLSVAMTHENGEISTVAEEIDLKVVLPEKVSVGFSATTWDKHRERHDIYSWSFTSTLETNDATVLHSPSIHVSGVAEKGCVSRPQDTTNNCVLPLGCSSTAQSDYRSVEPLGLDSSSPVAQLFEGNVIPNVEPKFSNSKGESSKGNSIEDLPEIRGKKINSPLMSSQSGTHFSSDEIDGIDATSKASGASRSQYFKEVSMTASSESDPIQNLSVDCSRRLAEREDRKEVRQFMLSLCDSLSESGILNCNKLFWERSKKSEARDLWNSGKALGVNVGEDDERMIDRILELEYRDEEEMEVSSRRAVKGIP